MVAFRTSEPERFWVRSGLAAILGFDVATRCIDLEQPLYVYRTLLSWLRAASEGVVVINAAAWEARRMLRDAAEIVCEDGELARAVRDLTRQRETHDFPAIGYIDQGQ